VSWRRVLWCEVAYLILASDGLGISGAWRSPRCSCYTKEVSIEHTVSIRRKQTSTKGVIRRIQDRLTCNSTARG
jgi:hypothetical protein